jgi:hypothetical protein
MKTKNALRGLAMAVVLQMGMLAGSAQTNIYPYTGYETNITLAAGAYIISAYGAVGGPGYFGPGNGVGGVGAEMSAEFYFPTSTNLTLLVGGGGDYGFSGIFGDGGGGSFVVENNTPLVIAGGGGGGGTVDNGSNGIVSANGSSGGAGASIGGGGGVGGYGGGGGGSGYNPNGTPIGGGGGGGGFLGNGYGGYYGGLVTPNGGKSFGNGGNGGYGSSSGFGGGGGEGSGMFSGGGGGGGYSGGGGGGGGGITNPVSGSFVGPGGGGGGGSIIDSSAIAILAEVSGILSPDNPTNGEIIITAVPTPVAIVTTNAAFGFTDGVFGFDVSGPSGSNVVIQASTDLQTWIPLQTNLLGSGPLYFSDPHSTTNVQRFYRAQLSP